MVIVIRKWGASAYPGAAPVRRASVPVPHRDGQDFRPVRDVDRS
jgi:hypothetical protein